MKGATPDGETIRFSYVSAEAMVVTADNAAAIFDIGFPIARRYEDDTIDDVGSGPHAGGRPGSTDMTSALKSSSPRRFRAL